MRHQNDCQCDVCIVDDYTRRIRAEKINKIIKEKEEKLDRACKLLNCLGISTNSLMGTANVFDLYDILTDEEKLRELVSKLRMKAFW